MSSIADAIRNQAISAITGEANKALSSKNVGKGSDSAAMQQKSNFTTKNITYPINVEGDPMQGHYIMFMINEADSATLQAEKIGMTAKGVAKKLAREANIPLSGQAGHDEGMGTIRKVGGDPDADQGMDFLAGQGGNPGHNEFGGMSTVVEKNQVEHFRPQDQIKGGGKETHSLTLKKHATTRLHTAISLYMPPQVSVSYGMNYQDKEVGLLAETGSKIFNEILNTKSWSDVSTTATNIRDQLGKGTWQSVKMASIAAADTIAPGARTVIALDRGAIITPRMEMMLEGVSRRSFSYTFIFIPKSAQEAAIVEDIIYAFKFHMHPEYVKNAVAVGKNLGRLDPGKDVAKVATKVGIAGVGREMTIPSTFDIAYMYQKGPNNFLNKISTCFLKSMDVQYGGERFTAYSSTKGNFGSGPPPQRTSITLNFSELEIITKERIAEGY